MIVSNINESFKVTAGLVDQATGLMSAGQQVSYVVKEQPGDVDLSPVVSGTLTESSVSPGIYSTMLTISTAGFYTMYVTCAGYTSNTEDIKISSEDINELVKQNRNHNTLVEDVLRTNATPTASQTTRKVPDGGTDYILTKIKQDQDSDWTGGDVIESRIYAWYRNVGDTVPYKMGSIE